MSRGWLACVVFALTWIGAQRDARAQTIVHLTHESYDPHRFALDVPVDPALVRASGDNWTSKLVSVADASTVLYVSLRGESTCADANAAIGGDLRARPDWAPEAYGASVGTLLCLATPQGVFTINIGYPENDLPAVINALEGIVIATGAATPVADTVEPVQTKEMTIAGDLTIVVDAWWSLGAGTSIVYVYTTAALDFRHGSRPCVDEIPDDGQRVSLPGWVPTGFHEWATDTGAGVDVCVDRAGRSLFVRVTGVETNEDKVTGVLAAIAAAASEELAASAADVLVTPTSGSTHAQRKSIFPLGIEVDLHWRITSPFVMKPGIDVTPSSGAGVGLGLHKSAELKRANKYLALGLEADGSLGYDTTYAVAYDVRAALAARAQLEIRDMSGDLTMRAYFYGLGGAGYAGVSDSATFVMPGAASWFWGVGTVAEFGKKGRKLFWEVTFAHRSVETREFDAETRLEFGISGIKGWGLQAEWVGMPGIAADEGRDLQIVKIAVSHAI